MPLLAAFLGSAFSALATFLGTMMAADRAMAWARRVVMVGLLVAFPIGIAATVVSLLNMTASALSGLPSMVLMGIGMFIPSNAAVVLALMGVVWLAGVLFRMKYAAAQ